MKHTPVIAVIGAGAAGMTAAISAAREIRHQKIPADIVMYEANDRVGKKLPATGNGRCNFTNQTVSEDSYAGDLTLFRSVYPQFNNNRLIRYFYDLGLPSKTDFAGRVYPLSNCANDVLDCLRYELESNHIQIVTGCKITSLRQLPDNRFLLNGCYKADKVILATGGCASPVHGSDGSGYQLARQVNIEASSVYPALTAIKIKDFTKSLKGIRAEGKITAFNNGKVIAQAEGELQYTDYGISGIPAMQISRHVSCLLHQKQYHEVLLSVDSAPSFPEQELRKYLTNQIKRNPGLPAQMLVSGIMPKGLGNYLLTVSGIGIACSASSVSDAALTGLLKNIKEKQYLANGVNGFSQAQVTAGGITSKYVNPVTLQAKQVKGLFVAGEILDIDGICGGYNLQWAFSSGWVAGVNAAKEITGASD